ncbi:transposase, partial [Acinetobacter baumannii]
ATLGGKSYMFVIVDDYSRFTWVMFIATKDETFEIFVKFCTKVQYKKCYKITEIRTDHGGEFDNYKFEQYCDTIGIDHTFSAPRTPQQNGVVERKNRTLVEMARSMLNEKNLPKYLWAEAINTACYITNRALIRPILLKTPYELWKDKKPNLSHVKVFGCKCFILNTKDHLEKFDSKADEGIFLGYSSDGKSFRIFNKKSLMVEESVHVMFNENPESNRKSEHTNHDDDVFSKLEKM